MHIQLKPEQKQTLHFSKMMSRQLETLQMNRSDLMKQLAQMAQSNPFIQIKENSLEPELFVGEQKNLKQELYLQLPLSEESPLYAWCSYIIESLDRHGFFNIKLSVMARDLSIPEISAKKALDLIQSLEPAGVAATNGTQALILQLLRKKQNQAAMLLKSCEQELIQGNIRAICSKMSITPAVFEQLMRQIRACTPNPCAEYETESHAAVNEPDLLLRKENEDLILEVPAMEADITEIDQKDLSEEMKAFLQEAHFFIDGINRRNQTLLLVGNDIVHHQQAFFLYHGEKIPCTLEQIAMRTGLHISTISRTIKDKSISYEGKNLPLRSFLVSASKDGSSKDEICKAILWYIDREDHLAPWEDEELKELLESDEIFASRRVIAKYRKEMGIAGSRVRRKEYRIQSAGT